MNEPNRGMDDQPMLSVRQVAKILAMSPRWVRTRCASREIRAVRLCGDGPWRIFPDGLAKVLGEKTPRTLERDRSRAHRAMEMLGIRLPCVNGRIESPCRAWPCPDFCQRTGPGC